MNVAELIQELQKLPHDFELERWSQMYGMPAHVRSTAIVIAVDEDFGVNAVELDDFYAIVAYDASEPPKDAGSSHD